MTSNWKAVRRAAPGGVAVLPLGSLEAHGPHLPCGTDSLLVEGIVARAVAASDHRRVVVFPTVHYSVVEWARPLASAGASPLRLIAQLADTVADIHGLGFRRIVFVNGHVNLPAAQMAVWQLLRDGRRALYVDCCPYFMAVEQARAAAGEAVTHAGVVETSLMLALHPEKVDMGEAADGPGDLWGEGFPFPALRRAGVFCVPSIAALPEGVEGAATGATAELGEKLLEIYAAALAELLRELLGAEVPPGFLREVPKDPGA